MDAEFYENERKVNERKNKKQEAKENYAKSKLKKVIETSIQTCAIGALSDLEKHLGFLWNHGSHYSELTDEQRDLREKWLDARDSILRRADNSKKLSLKAVDRCDIKSYADKRYNLVIKNPGENGNGRFK